MEPRKQQLNAKTMRRERKLKDFSCYYKLYADKMDFKISAYLVHELLKVWSWRIQPIQVGVQSKIGKRFPGRRVRLHFNGTHADWTFMSDWTGCDHRNTLHTSVAHFTSFLRAKDRETEREHFIKIIFKPTEIQRTKIWYKRIEWNSIFSDTMTLF